MMRNKKRSLPPCRTISSATAAASSSFITEVMLATKGRNNTPGVLVVPVYHHPPHAYKLQPWKLGTLSILSDIDIWSVALAPMSAPCMQQPYTRK
jgi:hypothetical protein